MESREVKKAQWTRAKVKGVKLSKGQSPRSKVENWRSKAGRNLKFYVQKPLFGLRDALKGGHRTGSGMFQAKQILEGESDVGKAGGYDG